MIEVFKKIVNTFLTIFLVGSISDIQKQRNERPVSVKIITIAYLILSWRSKLRNTNRFSL